MKKVVQELNLTADPEFNRHIRVSEPLLPEGVRNTIKSAREAVFGPPAEKLTPPPSARRVMDDTIDATLDEYEKLVEKEKQWREEQKKDEGDDGDEDKDGDEKK